MDHCSFCKEPKECHILLLCSRCKTDKYCSKECQKKNWPNHKINCSPKTDNSIDLVRKNILPLEEISKDIVEVRLRSILKNENLCCLLLAYVYHLTVILKNPQNDLTLCVIGKNRDNNYVCELMFKPNNGYFDQNRKENVYINLAYMSKNGKAIECTFDWKICKAAYDNIDSGIDFFKFRYLTPLTESSLLVVDTHKHCAIILDGTTILFNLT